MIKLTRLYLSFLGIGYLKPLPGTYASFVVFVMGYFLYSFFTLVSALILFIVIFSISYHSITQIIKYSNNKDPKWIVIDEVLGSILILIFIPHSILIYIIALLIFRIFDGQKIWPINLFNKIKTPLGVMVDDLAAGILAILITRLVILFIK